MSPGMPAANTSPPSPPLETPRRARIPLFTGHADADHDQEACVALVMNSVSQVAEFVKVSLKIAQDLQMHKLGSEIFLTVSGGWFCAIVSDSHSDFKRKQLVCTLLARRQASHGI